MIVRREEEHECSNRGNEGEMITRRNGNVSGRKTAVLNMNGKQSCSSAVIPDLCRVVLFIYL